MRLQLVREPTAKVIFETSDVLEHLRDLLDGESFGQQRLKLIKDYRDQNRFSCPAKRQLDRFIAALEGQAFAA